MPVSALLDGKTDSAVGNVVGSNLFNRLFIPGVSALIAAPVVNIQRVRQEATIMIGSSLLLQSSYWRRPPQGNGRQAWSTHANHGMV